MSTGSRRRIAGHSHQQTLAHETRRRPRARAHAVRIDRSRVAQGDLATWMAIATMVMIAILLLLA